MLLAVLLRSKPSMAFEGAAEMRGVFKPNLIADIGYADILLDEHQLGLVKPAVHQILKDGHAGNFFKRFGQIIFA